MRRNKSIEACSNEANQDAIKGQAENIRIEVNDIAVIIKTGSKGKTPVLITVLPVIALLISLLPAVFAKSLTMETARTSISTLLLASIVVFYIRFNISDLCAKRLFLPIICTGFLGSLALLLYFPKPGIFVFWMFGGLIIAMLLDQRLGMLVHFAFSVLLGINYPDSPKLIIQVMLTGLLMILLSGALKQISTFVYAAIIILSSNITVAFILNNFIFPSESGFNYLYSMFSFLILLALAFAINYIYSVKFGQFAASPEKLSIAELNEKEQAEGKETAKEDNKQDSAKYFEGGDNKTDASLELLCHQNNSLLMMLKNYSAALYAHSERIADLSMRAAMELGADARLALAGGLYHEIGRIRGGANYIEDGLAIADEYNFPAELKAIIKEHNIKYDKPRSLEAAIVMLADSVEASIGFVLKNEGNKYSTDKIIDNLFKLRMEKGTFDACPLKIKDYKKLRDFFIKEYAQNAE